MKRNSFVMAGLLASAAFAGVAQSAIIVAQEKVTPGTTWPETNAIQTQPNPSLGTNGVGTGTSGVVAETVTPSTTFTLGSLWIRYAVNVATSASFTLRIQEATPGLNPGGTAYTYPSGAALVASGTLSAETTIVSGVTTPYLMKFDFSDADQVTLNGGTVYAIEFVGVTTGLNLYRQGSDTYGGGMAFTATSAGADRNSVNNLGHRDLAMALVAAIPVPEPTSVTVVAVAGGVLFARRRR